MRIHSYNSAVRYLESLIPDPAKKRQGNMRLERIEHLLRLIGNPEKSFKSIHIGGTSGKGSTAYITAAILKEAGYNTGLHLSPHLEKINERLQINGKLISDKEFTNLVAWIKPYVKQVEKEGEYGAPSYFEVLVAMSFEYFKRKKVEIAVIEVGLGGTLDATNVIHPLVAIITNVGLDHTEILGNTVEKIAREKAGIIKEGIEVVTAATQKSVLGIIKKCCKEKHARLTIIEKRPNVPPLRPIGEHQKVNAACAIMAIKKLGFKVSETAIERALLHVQIPGRFEVIEKLKKPTIVLDGAHNPAKMRALVDTLRQFFAKRKITFVFAAKKGKDAEAMLRLLAPLAEKFYFTRFQATTDFGKNQSMNPEELGKILKKINRSIQTETSQNSKKTFYKIVADSKRNFQLSTFNFQLICVTGSLYLVGEARKLLNEK
ncbi:MAG: folylpolyglutamate synthase/dihydrofolate synthase family protein [Nanoarchaeota archaeon]|nr:folylpolyglutamate synthase/dihydrofolate synthase family protein [Nanoarchaeota archaeon]